MKTLQSFAIAGFVALTLMPVAANAAQRLDTQTTTCETIQNTLAQDGEAILRFPSKNADGVIIYGRYVGGNGSCHSQEVATSSSVPTSDGSMCPVTVCQADPD
jgi:hypothetical protein